MASIELRRRIRWADADAAGRLHFPRIFEYFEEGEGELLRSVGITMFDRGGWGFPRQHVVGAFFSVFALAAPVVVGGAGGGGRQNTVRGGHPPLPPRNRPPPDAVDA